jgi:hypothetical protein
MAGAVVAAIVLTILLPAAIQLGPGWLLPLIEVVLLIAVISARPPRASESQARGGAPGLQRIGPQIAIAIVIHAIERLPGEQEIAAQTRMDKGIERWW